MEVLICGVKMSTANANDVNANASSTSVASSTTASDSNANAITPTKPANAKSGTAAAASPAKVKLEPAPVPHDIPWRGSAVGKQVKPVVESVDAQAQKQVSDQKAKESRRSTTGREKWIVFTPEPEQLAAPQTQNNRTRSQNRQKRVTSKRNKNNSHNHNSHSGQGQAQSSGSQGAGSNASSQGSSSGSGANHNNRGHSRNDEDKEDRRRSYKDYKASRKTNSNSSSHPQQANGHMNPGAVNGAPNPNAQNVQMNHNYQMNGRVMGRYPYAHPSMISPVPVVGYGYPVPPNMASMPMSNYPVVNAPINGRAQMGGVPAMGNPGAQNQDMLFQSLVNQLNYYFSLENLCKDMYLRKHMDSEGFVQISFVASFNRVKTLSSSVELVTSALSNAPNAECVDGKVRTVFQPQNWVLPASERIN